MKLWKSGEGPEPKRKSKPKPNVLDRYDEFLKLKSFILSGKAKPFESAGLYFDQADAHKLGLKFPWRAAAEALRRIIKDANLQSDYEVVKFETNQPGVWFVRVTYEPPNAVKPAGRRS